MGNSQGKESQKSSPPYAHRPVSRHADSPTNSSGAGAPSNGPSESVTPPSGSTQSLRHRRGSRHDITLFGLGNHPERDPAAPEARKETKAEREARKLEKERAAREKERERSVKEEGVDGGYLVTMGVYTGSEDFSKAIVRQLQIERRLAPFWRGLNDFSDMWTEHQLVAAARGLPIPAPDESPPEESSRVAEASPGSSDVNICHLTVPISSRSHSCNSESPAHPAFSLPSPVSPIGSPSSPTASPFFRGRAKTLAALTTSSRNNSQADMTPQEVQLPNDPNVNGQPIEAFLYKEASECPICFLYYPPYLNKTRCCDQPICSECFVQIKRPDPHPPEHHDDDHPNTANNGDSHQSPSDEFMLVSEPATCPFCKQPEFGITYDPPPFRRGLTYANYANGHPLANVTSAMSSSSSINSQSLGSANKHKRRTTSLGANEPNVITTDKIRPDWAKKLADMRAHALRRAAAATALHNAAYVLGNVENASRFGLGRRRRTLFGGDSPGGESSAANVGALLAAAHRQDPTANRDAAGQSDLFPGRHSSRRSRIEDLEELMMMEAIRLSLAAEEERKRKEEKEAAKQAKKEEKQKAKELKKAEKAAKKVGMYPAGRNASNLSQMTTGTSNTNNTAAESGSTAIPVPVAGKGKAVDRSGSNEPESCSSSALPSPTAPKDDPQKHLEQSRAQIHSHGSPTSPDTSQQLPSLITPFIQQPYHRHALRQRSTASSSASSFTDPADLDSDMPFRSGGLASSFEPSPNASGVNIASNNPFRKSEGSFRSETPPGGGAGTEPMFNFRSLAAVIGDEERREREEARAKEMGFAADFANGPGRNTLGLGNMEDSAATIKEPDSAVGVGLGKDLSGKGLSGTDLLRVSEENGEQEDGGFVGRQASNQSDPYDAKHYGDISVLESRGAGQAA